MNKIEKTIITTATLSDEIQEHEEDINLIKEAMTDFTGLNFTVTSSGNKKWSTTTIRNLKWSEAKDFRGNTYISVDCFVESEDEIEVQTLNSINFYLDPVMIVDYNFGCGTLTITDEDGESIEFSEF